MKTTSKIIHLSLTCALTLTLAACGAGERLKNVGKAPDQSPVESPTQRADYKPVSMPMPAPRDETRQINSLWADGRQTFFKDQRAKNIGDILTVTIDITDEAELKNRTTRTRSNSEDLGVPHLLGLESKLGKVLPDAVDPDALAEVESASRSTGDGQVKREEDVKLRVAAVVSQILPNGNMVIHGQQEVRVNFENRILQVAGVIRPEDISIENTIPHDKIAEARIAYGGKGQLTDVQQPRYGQQVFDVILPF